MAAKIQFRRDLAANWASINPLLAEGEMGVELDVNPLKFKIGDGITLWNDLPYEGSAGSGSVTDFIFTDANGIVGTVTDSTSTPTLELELQGITPSSVAASGTVTGSNLSGVNTGDQTISLTGDVTGSGTGSFAATIATNAVTNAKAAQMPANTIKGNDTVSAANQNDLTPTQITAMLDIFTNLLKGLVPPSGGGITNFLRADGTWSPTSGNSYLAALQVVMVSSNLVLQDLTIHLVDTTSVRSLTLPPPAVDVYIVVKDFTGLGNTNNITIIPNGSEKIEGVAGNYVMNGTFEQSIFVSNGTDWVNIS